MSYKRDLLASAVMCMAIRYGQSQARYVGCFELDATGVAEKNRRAAVRQLKALDRLTYALRDAS